MESKMTVKNGDFLRIEYTQYVDGKPISTPSEDLAKEKGIYDEEREYGPRLIVMGAGQLVPGFEEELMGREIGYQGRVEVSSEKAYGAHDPAKVEIVPANRFKEEPPRVGMRVGMEGKLGVVTRVIGRKASVDFNHPLAGKAVVYEYRIVEGVEDRLERLKGLVKTFGQMDLECGIEDDRAIIYAPWEMSYYKEWLMIRRGLADMIIQHLGLAEVDFVERHTAGPKIAAEMISPPPKEGDREEAPKEEAAAEEAEQVSGQSNLITES
jgi:FKBP-type peptidyl-prolyl cis-trans isomerase 2